MTVQPQLRKRPRPWIVLSAIAATAIVAVVLGLMVGPWRSTPVADATPDEGLTWYPPGQRQPAPNASGRTLDGEELSLRDFRGQVVVVNVWGSWCVPCREEAPDLARLARETKSAGVQFIGIDTRDTPAAARAFVRRYHIPYPSINDQDGTVLLRFANIIPVSAVPSTLVIDPNGKIAARVIGRVTYRTLHGLINDTLTEPHSQEP